MMSHRILRSLLLACISAIPLSLLSLSDALPIPAVYFPLDDGKLESSVPVAGLPAARRGDKGGAEFVVDAEMGTTLECREGEVRFALRGRVHARGSKRSIGRRSDGGIMPYS